MEQPERHAAPAHRREIHLVVGLRNRSAIRFWAVLGYDRVTKIRGDRKCGAARFAVIRLAKKLSGSDS